MGYIKNGQKIPTEWVEGTIAHIYKNKGGPGDTKSYRPSFITQIIYKMRAQPIASKLPSIAHLIANQTQFGYNTNLSTINAVVKVESFLEGSTPSTHL